MNATSLHYNFIDPREIRNSSPITARFLIPVFLVICLLSSLIVWQSTVMRYNAVLSHQRMLDIDKTNHKAEYATVHATRSKEAELKAQLAQLAIYKSSRHAYGAPLGELTNSVSDHIQITELRVSSRKYAEPLPGKGPKAIPVWGPTNKEEAIDFKISGRVLADHGTESVGAMLQALQSPAFKELVRKADIPKGAFRQETRSFRRDKRNDGEVLLYEITCDCFPRKFE